MLRLLNLLHQLLICLSTHHALEIQAIQFDFDLLFGLNLFLVQGQNLVHFLQSFQLFRHKVLLLKERVFLIHEFIIINNVEADLGGILNAR